MTQTATTIEQSRKLLELGIDPETADMHIEEWRSFDSKREGMLMARKISDTERRQIKNDISHTEYTPAWSLSALIALIPMRIGYADFRIFAEDTDIWYIGYAEKPGLTTESPDIFTACIDLIEQLVKQGYIKTKKV